MVGECELDPIIKLIEDENKEKSTYHPRIRLISRVEAKQFKYAVLPSGPRFVCFDKNDHEFYGIIKSIQEIVVLVILLLVLESAI